MQLNRYFKTGAFLAVISILAACSGGGKSAREESRHASSFSGSSVSPGYAVPELASYKIAYYEAQAASENEAGLIQESDEPFTVVDFGPQGELPQEIRKASIYVVFSQPVVPLAKLGEVLREDAGIFTIDPPLEGVYRWYGTRLLSFEPDAEVIPQRRYTITVTDQLRSLGGKSLEGERSFSFETERLSLLSWSLGDGKSYVNTRDAHPEEARNINLIFSYPVNLSEIAKWIELRCAGKVWPFTLSRPEKPEVEWYDPEQAVRIRLSESLPMNASAELVLLAGARSEASYLGSREDKTFRFHTLLPFTFDEVTVRAYTSPRTEQSDSIPVSVIFSHPVDPAGVEQFFSIDGLEPISADNVRVYGNTVVLNRLPLQYQHSYTLRIRGGLKDLWGRQLNRDLNERVSVGQASSYVYIHNRGSRMLEAAYPPKVVWEPQNPVSLRYLIASAGGPYERSALHSLEDMDAKDLSDNKKHYFMEDLLPYLGPGGRGSVGMRWEYQTRSQYYPDRINRGDAWLTVQVTDIGLTVRYAYNKVLVWATRLSTGEPIAGARVELLENRNMVLSRQSDASGLAVFEFSLGEFASLFTSPDTSMPRDGVQAGKGLRIKVSEKGGAAAGGDEVEFIPNNSHNLWRFNIHGSGSPFTIENERAVVFLFTDRGLYRPGETVTFRGIDRSLKLGDYAAYEGPYSIEVSTGGYQAALIASLTGNTTKNGGSYGSFKVPSDLDPGTYTIRYKRGEVSHAVSFTVANFERLRFEASLSFPDMLFYAGERLSARFSASYLAGGALSGAPYRYYWTKEAAAFNPGGKWAVWRFGPQANDGRSYVSQGEGVMDAAGQADIRQDIPLDGTEGLPYRYRLEASVQDAARQEISSRGAVMVHPASFYIGGRIDAGKHGKANTDAASASAYFLAAGKPATLSWALLNPEGEAYTEADTEVQLQLVRYEWKTSRQAGIGGQVNLVWERVEEIEEEHSLKLSDLKGESAGAFSFTPEKSGQWEIRLRSRDRKDRPVFTRFSFYVSGAGWVRWGSDNADSIDMTPDKSIYAPGETAQILVRSPLPKGKYLLTIEREGIISEKIIELDGSALTIDVPIEERYVPIVYVALSSYTVRSGPPENTYYEPDLDKPKGVFGVATLYVDNTTRHYQVEIEPAKGVYGPAEEAEVKLKVTLNGKPVSGAELSFMAVDRGVVDLIDYHVPDPLAYFYNPRFFPLAVRGGDSRSLLIDPVTYALSDLQGGDAEEDSKLNEREDFRPTAVFEPFLVTGKDGTVTVRFKLPDSLTTYRCTAVAVGTEEFGIREQDLRVSAPLTATAALPRKLRWRDTGTASLILTNLEYGEVEASVSLDIESEPGALIPLAVDGDASRTVKIKGGATVEVPFNIAALGSGEGRLVFTLRSPSVNERIIRTLSVDRPVVYETVSTIGNLSGEKNFMEEGMVLPSAIPEGTGTVSLSLSASRLALLKEAVGYLLNYPYGCLEQRTAFLLPLVAFGEHLDAFQLESPVKDPKKVIEDELAQLSKHKLADGSYPYWPGGMYGNYYVTLRVAHIAMLAQKKGYTVPGDMDVKSMLTYLVNSEYARKYLSRDPFLEGYSLWIRAMSGERVGTEISGFLRRGDELGISGYSFAGLAALELDMKDLAGSVKDRVKRFIRPGTRTLDLTDTYERRGNFWGYESDRYALALMLFHALSPNDDMTTRLATALIEQQRRGQWSSTSTSYWAILAFAAVSDAEMSGETDFAFRSSLGGAPLLNGEFRSYGGVPESGRFSFEDTPIAALERDTLLPLRIEREGTGSLYYTASLRYGIPTELAGARDEGIGVFAETFDSDGNPVTDRQLAAGKTYTRRVHVSSSRARNFLALRVPVPSGAEIVDAVFVTSSTEAPKEDDSVREQGRDAEYEWWYDSRPVRFIMDDEVRFHWDHFPQGKKEVEFRFRAVMPGVYPTPPASAECMYEAEVFGRAAGELYRILKAAGTGR
ncbi:alpha-2-macroglobulin [Treponema sp. OttesenSCG-928-L16]|nr:alpha-2-macroglobulin [Treponema sp. OttesenSCG-928-L16]